MIHTTQDFYNKVATELRSKYFADENHGITENKNYHKTSNTLELFNNGCLTYRQLIGRLSKSCEETTENIHKIVEKYVVSFGSYNYQPKKNLIMKTYKIPIIYQRLEFVEVKAENLQTATENALNEFLNIPDDKYLEDSFEIDDIYVQENYPNEKLDYSKLLQ